MSRLSVDRRESLVEMGLALLAIQFLPLKVEASTSPQGNPKDVRDHLTVRLTPGFFAHVHELLIPYALLQAPPKQGVALQTTEALFHTHRVALTQAQLANVNRGGRVTGRASSHSFVIALPGIA